MVSPTKIDAYIQKWEPVSKQKGGRPEMRNRLKSLRSKSQTSDVQAEIKAIETLLA